MELKELLSDLCSSLERDMGVLDKRKHTVEYRSIWLNGGTLFVSEILVDGIVRVADRYSRPLAAMEDDKIIEALVHRRIIRHVFARGIVGSINAINSLHEGPGSNT